MVVSPGQVIGASRDCREENPRARPLYAAGYIFLIAKRALWPRNPSAQLRLLGSRGLLSTGQAGVPEAGVKLRQPDLDDATVASFIHRGDKQRPQEFAIFAK
ncbi:hypothetical protein B1R42_09705 [Trueperella pyogenes]|nr:hypothetical protein B1R42_09705 [Trueperella pyogenes]